MSTRNADRPTTAPTRHSDDKLRELGRAVIRTEAHAVARLADRIDGGFAKACRLLLECEGRIVVLGMGKSGHIGGKIAATLASTGSPAFFVHPGEASHGDLGMITAKDAVLALSNSGETEEILTILPLIKRLGVPLITLTGNPDSTLGRQSDVAIDVSVDAEACPLGLAPTSSTTATLVIGDALAVSLLEVRGFTADDFARSHPAGQLGKRLLLKLSDVMHTGEAIPRVTAAARLTEALLEMSRKGLGMTAVVDSLEAGGRVIGIFTDGDLRRTLDTGVDIRSTTMGEVAHPGCLTVRPETLAAEAVHILEQNKITGLLVVDGEDRLIGALNIHDLFRAGVM